MKEADFDKYLALAKTAIPVRTSPLGQFEVTLVIRRHELDGKLNAQSANELADELWVDLVDGVVELIASDFDLHAEIQHVLQTCFQCPQPISIRTLDVLHLAAALSVSETEFVSNDIRQRAAAEAMGMTVLP